MKTGAKFFIVLYSATILLFLVYFSFISDNNISKHRELNRKIKNLENNIAKTKNQVNNIYSFDQLKNNSLLLEQYARENMNLHKEEEDVFIIIYE
ncbi:MAG: septum formation initiator family protein [Bacteroidales bacterium]